MIAHVLENPFMYWNPDAKSNTRQHGQFSPHPVVTTGKNRGAKPQASPPSQAHSRGSSCGSQAPRPAGSPSPGHVQPQLTPKPLPKSSGAKPTIVIKKEDMMAPTPASTGPYLFPTTPPLSISGSAAASPMSFYGAAPTPTDNGWFVDEEDAEKVKNFGPPGAPLMAFVPEDAPWMASPRARACNNYMSSVMPLDPVPDLFPAGGCPLLSPAPSPHLQSTIESSIKRDYDATGALTVIPDINDPLLQPVHYSDAGLLPTLCEGDEDYKTMLRGDQIPAPAPHALLTDGTSRTELATPMVVPAFEHFSDFDSEDGLVHSVPPEHTQFLGFKRQRTGFAPFDDDHATHFLAETESDLFDRGYPPTYFGGLPTPPESDSSRRGSDDACSMRSGHGRPSRAPSSDADYSDDDNYSVPSKTPASHAAASYPSNGRTAADTHHHGQAGSSGRAESSSGGVSQTGSSDGAASARPSAPTSRRGRKQSLTEDPSKTFVCELCSRRFRRQEHLKRHYRSLHTQEKPFECTDCGKRFSRSDNLAQHARTHGSGSIVMNVLDESELAAMDGTSAMATPEQAHYGNILYEAAYDALGSTSSSSNAPSVGETVSPPPMMSQPSTEKAGSRRKRKRDD